MAFGMAVGMAAAGLLPSTGPALAADPGPWPPPPGRPRVEVVARGLDNPRGLAFGLRGELYVAEAGRGGAGPCQATAEGGTVCSGGSGAVTVVEFGRQWRVVSNLPSTATLAGTRAVGPSDVAVGPGGELVHVTGADGGPVAMAISDRGRVVVDPGRNALVRVGPRGRAQTIATFPRRAVDTWSGIAVRRSVSAVAAGPDGAWYVGETTGTTEPGAARIWRVEAGRSPRPYATGFTGVVDLAWSPQGLLYVLEPDALIEIDVDGSRRVITPPGLVSPGGLAVRGGHVYVTNCGTCQGAGTVLRLRR